MLHLIKILLKIPVALTAITKAITINFYVSLVASKVLS